jgi:hypothetical protein
VTDFSPEGPVFGPGTPANRSETSVRTHMNATHWLSGSCGSGSVTDLSSYQHKSDHDVYLTSNVLLTRTSVNPAWSV